MKSKNSTKSEEVRHQPEYSISSKRNAVNYSERKQQYLLKYSILGGPNEEYYQNQIEKTQKQIEKIQLQQSKIKSKFRNHQKQFDKLSKQMKKIKKSISSLKLQEEQLEQSVKKIKEQQQELKKMTKKLNAKINQIKDQILNLEEVKNRIEFNISIESNSYNRLKKQIKGLDKQSEELYKYLLKLQNNKRMGPHWTNMK